MNKKLFLSLLTIAVFLFAVQVAGPVSAATLIDSGKNPVLNRQTGVTTGYWYYKTWNDGKQLHTKIYATTKKYGWFMTAHIYLKKTDSNTLKIYHSTQMKGDDYGTNTHTLSTKKTATEWYKKRPLINSIMVRNDGNSKYDPENDYWYIDKVCPPDESG